MGEQVLEFHVPKSRVAVFPRSNGKGSRFMLMPSLLDFPFGEFPDNVNPRSHGKKCLKTHVARDILATLEGEVENFTDRNRGLTILSADGGTTYNARNEMMRVLMDKTGGVRPLHGLVDGGTTDAVVAAFKAGMLDEVEGGSNMLADGSVNVEIITGVTSLSEVADISAARNSSIQVKLVSLADLRGTFDWLKRHLSERYPAAEGGEPGVIAYDENAQGHVNVLDVLCILHLFHETYCDSEDQPKESYTAKKEMTRKLEDTEIQAGFKQLLPVTFDILDLHDYIWSTFADRYNASGKRLGGVKSMDGKKCFEKYGSPRKLYFSDHLAKHRMPRGVLYPVLSSLRCLLKFGKKGASWTTDPHEFWDKHGTRIVAAMFQQFKNDFASDPNKYGKSVGSYANLFHVATLLSMGKTVRIAG